MLEPLDEHYGYQCNRIRLERYRTAIERAVQPSQAVMDFGCRGGLLGIIALRSGVARVLAMEKLVRNVLAQDPDG